MPDIIKKTETGLVFIYDGDADALPDLVHSVARLVKSKIPVYICPEKSATKHLGITGDSAFAIVTDNGSRQNVYPASEMNNVSKTKLQAWVLENRLPLVPELAAHNQKDLTTAKYLFIMLLDTDAKPDLEKLAGLKQDVKIWQEKYPKSEVRFSWLDAMKYTTYAEKVYGIKPADLPAYVITYPTDEIYYYQNVDGSEYSFQRESMFQSIEDVVAGKGLVSMD